MMKLVQRSFRVLIFFIFSLYQCFALASNSPPKVLTSIKPLQLIAAAITNGISEPKRLIPSGRSPHQYSMRPSDFNHLYQADVVVWVGPSLEVFLQKPLVNNKNQALITAAKLSGVTLLKDTENYEDHEAVGHSHLSEYNPHLWLSPANALAIAKALTTKLSQIDPRHQEQYSTNLKDFTAQMDRLKPVNNPTPTTGFFVYHGAWSYLADYYQLHIIDDFTKTPELRPGAKHLLSLRQAFSKAAPTCMFEEPEFDSAQPYLEKLTKDLDIKLSVIDPLATSVKVDSHGYSNFIQGTLNSIKQCLDSVRRE